jgi:hypothetical protein
MLKIPYLIPVSAQQAFAHAEHYYEIAPIVTFLKKAKTTGEVVLCYSIKKITHPNWYRLFLDKENTIPEGVHLITREEIPYLITPVTFPKATIYVASIL